MALTFILIYFLLNLIVFLTVILKTVLVLEGLQADVAREAWRVVVVDREMLGETRGKSEALFTDRTFVCLVEVIQLVILQSVLALEALVALLALINLVVVHDLVLLEANQCWEYFVAYIADLR